MLEARPQERIKASALRRLLLCEPIPASPRDKRSRPRGLKLAPAAHGKAGTSKWAMCWRAAKPSRKKGGPHEIASDCSSLRSAAGCTLFCAGVGPAIPRLRQKRHDLRADGQEPEVYDWHPIPRLRQIRHDLRQVRNHGERGAHEPD